MTDKQTIECPFKGDDERCNAHLNEVFWWKCFEFDNCLFNKYKAKEQECEELKEKINSYICSDNCYRNKKLKQTFAEIKEIAQYDVYTSRTDLCLKLNWIKKKINEVLNVENN